MSTCPQCQNAVLLSDRYCSSCGKALLATQPKWFFRKGSLVTSFFLVGPLMLPLLWLNPSLSRTQKVVWTVVILGVTWGLIVLMGKTIATLKETYEQLQQLTS